VFSLVRILFQNLKRPKALSDKFTYYFCLFDCSLLKLVVSFELLPCGIHISKEYVIIYSCSCCVARSRQFDTLLKVVMKGHENLIMPTEGSGYPDSFRTLGNFERGCKSDPEACEAAATVCSHIYSPTIDICCHILGLQVSLHTRYQPSHPCSFTHADEFHCSSHRPGNNRSSYMSSYLVVGKYV
jgi:hypothetical protein